MTTFSSALCAALTVGLVIACSDDETPPGNVPDSGTSDASVRPNVQDSGVSPDGSEGRADASPGDTSQAPDSSVDAGTVPADGQSGAPDGPADRTAPEFRSALINTLGTFAQRFDLGVGDVTAVLPRETTAEVTIFAKDDVTAYQDLRTSVADGTGAELPVLDRVFSNGIWKLTVAVRPGMKLVPRATDAAGNTAVPLGSLVIATREEAISGAWHTRFFDPSTLVRIARQDSTWGNGKYTEIDEDTGETSRGTFAFDGDTLTVTVEAGDSGAPLSERKALSFIDDSAFSDGPFERATSSSTLPGTWTRSFHLTKETTNTTEDLTETLVLDDAKTFTRTTTGTRKVGNTTTNVNQVEKGTYRTTDSGPTSYGTGTVYFVGFTVTERNGSAVSGEPEEFDEYVVRGTILLLNPRRR